MRCLMCLFVLASFLLNANATRGADKIVLIAGGGSQREGVSATQAHLQEPFGVDFDRAGNLYLVEMTGHRVCRVDAKGILITFAGTGRKGSRGDGGPAREAEFNSMHSLAVAPNGDVFVADTWNNRIRRIDAKTGHITAFAGTGEKGFHGDKEPALQAQFGGVYCVALDPRGERLFVADLDNRRIRAIDLRTGVVTTVAGNGEKGVPQDGAEAIKAPLVDPRAVAVDAQSNVYILERAGHALRVVDAQGKIRTVAGTGKKGASGDGGPARQATLNGPKHLCIDRDGGVILADTENHVIRKYRPADGTIVRVAGTGTMGSAGLGGSPEKCELDRPHGVQVDATGHLYIADSGNHRVLKIERRD
jgi:DNA-binding beta-propeller fold protein YncE